DRDGSTLDPAEFTQSLHESDSPWTPGRSIRAQEPDGRQLRRLLCARRDWPRGRRTAEQRDELAALHSMSSSAIASSDGGTTRSTMRAVCVLITSSNLFACTIGKSAGFAPLRTRPT